LLKKIEENRTALRQRLMSFLAPEQLTKWDAEISKAKEFRGQKAAAAWRCLARLFGPAENWSIRLGPFLPLPKTAYLSS
jgi:hypothetical protein